MTFTFRPAVREETPLIVGISGPTKSGKTYSAMRVARGLARGGVVAMLNAEGKRGHQYADKFTYVACDIEPPFSPKRYKEAIEAAKELNPACLIIDSASHMHDGPGGMLEMHDDIQTKMARGDPAKKDRVNFAAWIEPKRDENQFIYALLGMKCPVVLCFRAKEKLKIIPGKEPVNLGWQPISSDRVAFETIFTLVLPPHSKGVPDKELSEMREPFDTMVDFTRPIDERLGEELATWATGKKPAPTTGAITADQVINITDKLRDKGLKAESLCKAAGVESVQQLPSYEKALAWIDRAGEARTRTA